MKAWIIRHLGGFVDIDEAIDEIKRKDTLEKYSILTLAVRKLFNTISADDILREKNGQMYFQGRALSKGEGDLLKAEATRLLDSKLWTILNNDIQYQANKKLFVSSTSQDDMVAGKLFLYTLDVIKTRLNSLSSGSGLFNRK